MNRAGPSHCLAAYLKKQGIVAGRYKKYMEVRPMKEIYHNMKTLTLIILMSAVCVNLGIIEDFFRMVIYLTLFFFSFTKWKLKKIINKKEEKHFLLIFLTLASLFVFLVKEETIFNIPMEYVGIVVVGLVSLIVMKIIKYINRRKENIVK